MSIANIRLAQKGPKLSEQQVEKLRALKREGLTLKVLAQRFEVSRTTVSRLTQRARKA